MELNLQRQTITINEVVYDGYVEQPIECDALLPDYCPDIVGILKCTVSTHIVSTTVNGDRMTVEGIMTAHVFYTADNGSIRHTDYKIPFGRSVEMRAAVKDPVVSVVPTVDYVNCRAVNQRRIDLRGALSLGIKVTDSKDQEVISDAAGGGLQLRREMVKATHIVSQTQSPFTIAEDLEVGPGKAPIGSIIRSDCRVSVQDYKIIAGKVVVKGDFLLHILYQPLEDSARLEAVEFSLPISQIVDSEGTDGECVCDVQVIVTNSDIQPRQNSEGEYLIFGVDARLLACVSSHRHAEIPVASDCFSTMYECSCKQEKVTFIRLVDVVNEVVSHKASLDLPEEVDSVLDSWCEVDTVSWKQADGGLDLALRVTVSMFAKMQDGQSLYFEQSGDIEHRVKLEGNWGDLSFEPTADVISSAFNLAGRERIDIRCEVLIKGCVYCTVKQKAIGDITVDESKEKTRVANKLYIYYADAGESIWDIAKRYNTSPGSIWEENDTAQDVLTGRQMLLIPII